MTPEEEQELARLRRFKDEQDLRDMRSADGFKLTMVFLGVVAFFWIIRSLVSH